MKRTIGIAIALAALLSSCGGSVDEEPPVGLVTTLPSEHDDSTITEVEVYDNTSRHPDLVRICIEGTAWLTIDVNFDGPHVFRAADLDSTCPVRF